jgi:hypothetical protein
MGPAATRTRGLSQMCLDRLDSRALSENHTTSCYIISICWSNGNKLNLHHRTEVRLL